MNLYVETNFILELAFVQEQHASCNNILTLCEAGGGNLILPAFCIAESYSTLIRQAKRRDELADEIARELRQLSRSPLYKNEMGVFRNANLILTQSSQDEEQRLIGVLDRILRIAEIISLEAEIVLAATKIRDEYSLSPQDSVVLSSVLYHLESGAVAESCFINKNKRDFDDVDIVKMLIDRQCKILFNFDTGLHYIQKP